MEFTFLYNLFMAFDNIFWAEMDYDDEITNDLDSIV